MFGRLPHSVFFFFFLLCFLLLVEAWVVLAAVLLLVLASAAVVEAFPAALPCRQERSNFCLCEPQAAPVVSKDCARAFLIQCRRGAYRRSIFCRYRRKCGQSFLCNCNHGDLDSGLPRSLGVRLLSSCTMAYPPVLASALRSNNRTERG